MRLFFRMWCGAASITLLAGGTFSQTSSIAMAPPDPAALIRKAVDNEIKASEDKSARFMFRSTRTTARGSVTKVYVQAKDATAGIVVAYNGKPLTAQQRQDERSRIERFVKSPEELEKKRRQEKVDAESTLRIFRALPDAFLYEYAGEQLATSGVGKAGDTLLAFRFRPNPKYDPPSRIEQVLTGMEGTLLLDHQRDRLASLEGTLIKDVGFGWGILGHLDKGGRFHVQQQDVGDGFWSFSRTYVDVTGKILLFKNLVFTMTEVFSDFKPVPRDITFAQAVEMLEKEEQVFAENSSGNPAPAASAR